MLDDRPSTVTAPSPATLFVALDLSRSSWVVAVHAPHAGKVSRHKLAPARSAGTSWRRGPRACSP